ncbi:hypothetical protein KAU33_16695, partial [Candidatus Dependentiae bacterium]|nr:hypothetical protein [Candidatus Dependentiae bacterium]
MKKTKVYLVLLLVFCCVFILFQPTETVGAKTQKPIIKKIDSVVRDHPEGTQIKNEESKEKEPKVRTHLVKDTKQESINFGLKVPYRKNKQSMLPKLGEVKQIGKNKWETIRNPKTGKLMTVIADYVIVKYKPEFY